MFNTHRIKQYLTVGNVYVAVNCWNGERGEYQYSLLLHTAEAGSSGEIAVNFIASDFRDRLMRTHLAFFPRSNDAALQPRSRAPSRGVLKKPCDKSPNLIGWLYWRFAARSAENRRNGQTRRMPANLIANSWHTRYRQFYTPIAAIDENRNRCTGHNWRFSPIAVTAV